MSLDAFGSRRVVVDFADDALYVEDLAPDARLSIFLCDRSGMPFVIEGEKIKVAPIPGYYDADRVGSMDGSTVKRIAGDPAADWVKDLRSGNAEAVARMTKRFRALEEDYELEVVDADGNEHTVTIPGRGEPEGSASRWTLRREKA